MSAVNCVADCRSSSWRVARRGNAVCHAQIPGMWRLPTRGCTAMAWVTLLLRAEGAEILSLSTLQLVRVFLTRRAPRCERSMPEMRHSPTELTPLQKRLQTWRPPQTRISGVIRSSPAGMIRVQSNNIIQQQHCKLSIVDLQPQYVLGKNYCLKISEVRWEMKGLCRVCRYQSHERKERRKKEAKKKKKENQERWGTHCVRDENRKSFHDWLQPRSGKSFATFQGQITVLCNAFGKYTWLATGSDEPTCSCFPQCISPHLPPLRMRAPAPVTRQTLPLSVGAFIWRVTARRWDEEARPSGSWPRSQFWLSFPPALS